MKKIIQSLFLFLLLTQTALSQGFYDINTINTIEITFTDANWDATLDNFYAAGDEERLLGSVVINNTLFDSVGVRYKGNSTYNPNQIKNPLNIKLDHVIGGQNIEGFGTLKLANVFKDPSFVREALSYEIARDYMPASQANFAHVYINGSYLGLYTNVQSVDKTFLAEHFNNNDKTFFKGELIGNSQGQEAVWGYINADSSSYASQFELKSGENGWENLVDLLNTLNNDTESIEAVLNVDRHLWMIAFDNLMVNLDAPINYAHNYYLYQDDAGQFNPIIWDLNENFGVFNRLFSQQGPLNTAQMDPFLHSTNADYPIVSKILSNDTYKKMYVAHIKTIMADMMENDAYRTRALEIQDIIDTAVSNDPNKFYTYSNFTDNIDGSIAGGGQGPGGGSIIGITELMDARFDYLNTQAAFTATAPVISNVSPPAEATPYETVWFTTTLLGANEAYLYSRNSLTERFTASQMFDDGNHHDGAAGDGIFGASTAVAVGETEYYFYAQNDDAGTFLPARAANEFYTLTISAGDLVINEFMADNDTTVTDQDGDFDDWIELYNNTDSPINLNGYFLSDDGEELDQWAFPDTSIAANGYLIIWADKDDEQVGLHAGFKLSKSGEAIYLSNEDTLILDEIAFGEQGTDFSAGRYPNGTGDFFDVTPPSFAVTNNGTVVANENSNFDQPTGFVLDQNYPNPFNPSTFIGFTLNNPSKVKLTIFNALGQQVQTLFEGNLAGGFYHYTWEAGDLPSGVYFYQLSTNAGSDTNKMVLLR